MSTGTLFWGLALVLVLATLAALVVPLVRRHAPRARPGDVDASAAVYRDRKQELDAEVAAGAISPGERDAAGAELVAQLGEELAVDARPAPRAADRGPWIAALLLVALVPAAALVAYLVLGRPDALDANAARQRLSDTEIVAMVERLAQRMKENPTDPQGWLLLGRSFNALQRYPEAAQAFEQAAARLPGNADALADWADALAMAQGRKLAGRPAEIVAQALAANPAHPKSLVLAASAAMERGDDKAAVGFWRRVLAIVPPDSEDARDIRDTIAQLEGGKSGTAPSHAPVVANRVAGRVAIAPALAGRVPPDATLFVFARPPQGPRMPLAVVRRPARELPLEFVLDDSMAMAPGATISGAREVVIEARVSASGSATPAPGDLVGVSPTVPTGSTGIVVTIDRVLP